MNKLSAQLYSVRDYTDKDFFKTLETLANIGYTGVEFAGYGNISAGDMKAKLDELNLSPVSSHVGINILKEDLDSELEYLNKLGAKYIICPAAEVDTVESALNQVELFNKIGEKCASAGLTFAYHNHNYELKIDNGQYPLEVLFENVDPKYVKQQPDVYWLAYAGIDVNEYIKKNLSRCPIIHLKQLENYQTKKNVNAGDGIIDFAYLIDIAKNSEFVYEQEEYENDSMESMEKSFDSIFHK